ncbi:endonuclease domain-containing protein [Microbacterium sp. P05]|uniref:endonuclease domain-containing protein n=1 Tax=Microbacterium sp. P05 TaxID=3366948 RepID=UPI003745628B
MRTSPSIVAWLEHRDGVAHSTDLRAAGFGKAALADAVRSGRVVRTRRSWLCLSGADPRRVAAVSLGGRVTCVTQAELKQLWVPVTGQLHVAVDPTASRLQPGEAVLHWGRGPAPVGRTAASDHILNVLFHVARCLPLTEALAIWESAIRKKHVDAAVLSRVVWHSTSAKRLAEKASALSDSGLETIFVDGMRAMGVAVRQQVWIDGHPVDGLIGDRLAVQLDGFAHHRAADRRRDIEADARLRLRGYTVLRFDYYQLLFDWPTVVNLISAAIAQQLHLAAAR